MGWGLGVAIFVVVLALIALAIKQRRKPSGEDSQPKDAAMTSPSDLSSRIKQAADFAACERLQSEIVSERPDLLVVYFAELYEQRTKLAGADGTPDKEVAALLWETFGASRDDHRVVPEPSASVPDPLSRWRTTAASVFEHVRNTAVAPGTPAAIRALLLQALWELRSLWTPGGALPRAFDVVRDAISAHVEAAVWAVGLQVDAATRGMEAARHWRTALRLALEIGQPALLAPHVTKLHDCYALLEDAAPHWALAFLEVEIGLAAVRGRRTNIVSDQRLEEVLTALGATGPRLEQMGRMEHVEEELLGVQARVEALLGRGATPQEAARRRAAFHKRVAMAAPSGLVASMRWKMAAEEYLQAGLREDGANAKAEARAAIGRAEAQGEFKEVHAPLEISFESLESLLLPFFEGTSVAREVLGRMTTRLFVPSLETGRKANVTESLASTLLVTVPVVDDRTLAELVPGSDELARFEERRALLLEIAVMSTVVISGLFRKLREELHLHRDDLAAILSSSPYVEADDMLFLHLGIERYLRGDLVSAIHVLVPRVEQIIRRILRAAGTEVTALREGELRERPLGELLRAGETDGTLPTPLARLLQAVLSEDWGLNLRNRVAHGLLKPSEVTQAYVDRVLHIALLLARIQLEEEETPEPSEEVGA